MDIGMLFEGDIWDRRCSGTDAKHVRSQMLLRNPKEVHFGALWKNPGEPKLESNFLGRPLVIDIDLPDYKFSAQGSDRKVYTQFQTLRTPDRDPSDPEFRKSWVFIEIAVEIIDYVLHTSFGFADRKWVFSGNKGVHCWVLDSRACKLTSAGRAAIFDYLTFDNGFFKDKYGTAYESNSERTVAIKKKIFSNSKYLQFCYKTIREKMTVLLDDQQLWDLATEQVLCEKFASEAAAAKLGKSGNIRWCDYERVDYIRAVEFALKVALPRLDRHACKIGQMTKIPFSVHAKTGKIAVPFDAAKVDVFDPVLSPTLDDAIVYHDAVCKCKPVEAGKNIAAYARWFARKPGEAGSVVAVSKNKRKIPEGLQGLFKRSKQ